MIVLPECSVLSAQLGFRLVINTGHSALSPSFMAECEKGGLTSQHATATRDRSEGQGERFVQLSQCGMLELGIDANRFM